MKPGLWVVSGHFLVCFAFGYFESGSVADAGEANSFAFVLISTYYLPEYRERALFRINIFPDLPVGNYIAFYHNKHA